MRLLMDLRAALGFGAWPDRPDYTPEHEQRLHSLLARESAQGRRVDDLERHLELIARRRLERGG